MEKITFFNTKNFKPKFFFDQMNFWPQNSFDPKHYFAKKKNLYPKIVLTHNFFNLIFFIKFFFQPQFLNPKNIFNQNISLN